MFVTTIHNGWVISGDFDLRSCANLYRTQCLRQIALQRIAISSAIPGKKADLRRLHNGLSASHRPGKRHSSLSHSPISCSELEILLALCEAAPLLQDAETAERLFNQLSPYLLEASTQAIASSPFIRSLESSPWEILGYQLTRAVLSLGIRHPHLHNVVVKTTAGYLRNCLHTVNSVSRKHPVSECFDASFEVEDQLSIASVSVSLLGFLEALSLYAHFYDSLETLEVLDLLRQILDENLMLSAEGVFSSIRTFESNSTTLSDWKSYAKRYAASGKPLGAMLLQCGFMRFLVSCSSLQVTGPEQLQRADTFHVLLSDEESTVREDDNRNALIDFIIETVHISMRLLEDGADYLQLGSAWQQRLAFTVKANSLHAFLNCIVADEDTADVDVLMSWLEDTMSDLAQMADPALSYVILKSMAVVAKFSPSMASTLSHSLPRFIVQGGIRGESVIIAAQSLTFILQTLSQDAVITGLYSLGNVLSALPGTDRAIGSSDVPNGSAHTPKSTPNDTHHSTGSAISLDLSNEEETTAVHGNLVRAIVSIANGCQDEKITALAQSMLLQKLGRVSLAVDLQIIVEVAKLSTAGGPTEFKTLLKLYSRLGHEALVKRNSSLLEAVRC